MRGNVPVGEATLQEAVQALGQLVGAAKEGCWRCRSASDWAGYNRMVWTALKKKAAYLPS